jgi:hypothetical protein
MSERELIIFSTADGKISVQTRFDEETVWLSLDQIATLFDRNKSTISRHINNVFEEGELDRSATVANFATVQSEGDRQVERQIEHFNLDVIISVGYRVKSLRGTQFRQWASKRLNEYIRKGFALDDERLKNGGGRYITKSDVGIAKNYLTEKELTILNLLVSQFLDFAELQALEENAMTMTQWIAELDRQLLGNRRELLTDKGKITHKQALAKAEKAFEAYRRREMQQLESDFDRAVKQLAQNKDHA